MQRTVVHYGSPLAGGATRASRRGMCLQIPRGIPRLASKKLKEAHRRLRKIGVDLFLARNEALASGDYYLDTAANAFYAARDKASDPAPAYMWAQVRIPHGQDRISPGQKMLYFNHDLPGVSRSKLEQIMRSVFGRAYSWDGTNGKSMGVNLALASSSSSSRRKKRTSASRSRRRRRTSKSKATAMKRRIERRRRASSSSECPLGEGLKYYKPSRLSPPRPANHVGCRGKTICNSNGCWTSTPNSRGVHSWRK